MDELEFHRALALGVIATGAAVFVALLFINAPYGRHARGGWGPEISNRLGWILMESPAALFFAAVYALGPNALEPVPLVFCALWLTHYGYRAFVYPLRLPNAKKKMPLMISAMAVVFNVINAYLNARWLSALGSYPLTWLASPTCWIGIVAFVAGFALNVHADNILLALRKPGEQGYKVPQSGPFRWLSAPNYTAEIVEWGGFALATFSLAGFAFFSFTAANLIPRALAHHRWYQHTFPDYPKERRAIVPFVW